MSFRICQIRQLELKTFPLRPSEDLPAREPKKCLVHGNTSGLRVRPFVFFMSESQAFFDETQVNLHLARRNRLPAQRDMGGKWAFEKQAGERGESRRLCWWLTASRYPSSARPLAPLFWLGGFPY